MTLYEQYPNDTSSERTNPYASQSIATNGLWGQPTYAQNSNQTHQPSASGGGGGTTGPDLFGAFGYIDPAPFDANRGPYRPPPDPTHSSGVPASTSEAPPSQPVNVFDYQINSSVRQSPDPRAISRVLDPLFTASDAASHDSQGRSLQPASNGNIRSGPPLTPLGAHSHDHYPAQMPTFGSSVVFPPEQRVARHSAYNHGSAGMAGQGGAQYAGVRRPTPFQPRRLPGMHDSNAHQPDGSFYGRPSVGGHLLPPSLSPSPSAGSMSVRSAEQGTEYGHSHHGLETGLNVSQPYNRPESIPPSSRYLGVSGAGSGVVSYDVRDEGIFRRTKTIDSYGREVYHEEVVEAQKRPASSSSSSDSRDTIQYRPAVQSRSPYQASAHQGLSHHNNSAASTRTASPAFSARRTATPLGTYHPSSNAAPGIIVNRRPDAYPASAGSHYGGDQTSGASSANRFETDWTSPHFNQSGLVQDGSYAMRNTQRSPTTVMIVQTHDRDLIRSLAAMRL